MDWQNEETYVYDETNRLVQGKNEEGEVSLYTYNGLGIRVGRELIMKDNTHGYTDFHDRTPSVETGIDKPEVAVESYVVDYTTATRETLTMHEEGGFDYRWVYGLDKLSVKITSEGTNWWGQNVKQDILKDYLHQDRLGSTTNLTDKFGRVVGRADYNEWGEITYKDALDITSSYRRIWPQSSYTGHDWDDVLGMYYAKARFYDPDAKRFVAMDPVKGKVTEPLSLVPYVYCVDNPLRWVDLLGLRVTALDDLGGGTNNSSEPSKTTVTPATKETKTPARKQIAPIQVKPIVAPTPSEQQKSGIDLTDIAHANVAVYSESSGNATVKMGYLDANVGVQPSGGVTARAEDIIYASGAFVGSKNDPVQSGAGISIINAEAGALKVEYDDSYLGGNVDVLHAKMNIGANTTILGVEAMAELAGASGNVKLPIFNTGYEFVFTAEANIGSIGFVAGKIPGKGVGAKASIFAGVGFFVDFQPCQAKSNG